jgi:hypothetical protein
VRGQYSTLAKVRYRCYECFWAGDEPKFQKKKPNRFEIIQSINYEDIIKKMLSGASIRDQYDGYRLFDGDPNVRKFAIRQKILRACNAYCQYTKVPCQDPDFCKIKVEDDVLHLVINAIESEETKIRNAPRLSVTFSK